MQTLIVILAYLQRLKDTLFRCSNRVRRHILLPIAKSGGRDMLLLYSGVWIDDDNRIPRSHVQMRYDSEKHTVFLLNRESTPTSHDQWLSVTTEGHDLSDFFNDLRITKNAIITNDTRLMLFAHQKGWFPATPLSIVLRDGSVQQIPPLVHEYIDNNVNYIR